MKLPGKIGEMDVEFCENVIDQCLEKFPQLNKKNVGLLGGSHGGFIVTHLAGQKPDKYKAIVALNPALNIRTMFDHSDIPDWCTNESNCSNLEPGKLLDPELEKQMLSRSPSAHSHAIRAPFLLAVGGKDLRSFVGDLSANKVPDKVLYYPESNHQLAEMNVEADIEINTVLWFQKYLS